MKEKAAIVKIVLVAIVLCTLSATAGIKYWDNQAYKVYDVGDYVQDGLVVNYDGIRNAGPGVEHDPNATTWVNCANPGTYDATRYSTNGTVGASASATAAAWNQDASRGLWTENGFVFDKDAVFWEPTNFTLPTALTHQLLVDATSADQNGIGYPMCGYAASLWNNGGSIGIRNSGTIANTMYFTPLDNAGGNASYRPAISGSAFTYGTAILDGKEAVMFAGTVAPWSAASTGGTTGHYANSSYNPTVRTISNGFCIGGHYPRTDEMFKGTVKSYRFYSKALSDEEVAWNRVVDEGRYFNRRVALPVTNVVVASNIPIVTGEEPIGCYAVDAGGYTFSAPASKVVKGRTYTLDGFTVETWDGSAWSAAVPHTGETSYAATDAALVRLTWLWTPGDGLVAYDADDYVLEGLVLHYDGIRNVGLGVAHDYAATTWVNLVNPGTDDLTRYSLVSSVWQEGAATGAWTDDGFTFSKNALFRHADSFTVPTRYTTQAVFDAKQSEQENITYVVCPSPDGNANDWQRWSVGLRKTSFNYGDGSVANVLFYCVADAAGGRLAERGSTDKIYNYATAMLDITNAVVFTGTTAPWTASGESYGHRVKTGTSSALTLTKGFSIAGHYSTTTELLKGTVKDFRFYNRVLSDAEVAWNRAVDEARYFTEPNVVVASTRADVQANEEDGSYVVSGSYTFTAPASVTVGNITYEPAGYAIQPWDDAVGVWSAATEYEGASYAYTTAAGKVRLLWRWKAVSGIRAAADYDVSDYVAGGLTFHLDGIRNVGADVGHAETPATWVNLGTAGAAANTTIRGADADRVVNWTDKGYYFDGNTRFFATIPYTTTFTLQLCTDAVQNDQHNPSSAHIYPFTSGDSDFAISTYNTKLYFRTQGKGAVSDLGIGIDKTKPWGPITATLDDTTKTAAIFSGANSSGGARMTYDTMARPTISSLTLGGGGSDSSHYLIGTINYFRYYDRVLSDEELAQNRQVDQARYFGELGATNVFVVAGGGTQAEAGAYKVEGEWTFTATTTVDKRGETVPVVRYSIETLVDGAWANKRIYNGNSYSYTEGSSPATIRLKWLGRADGIIVIMR